MPVLPNLVYKYYMISIKSYLVDIEKLMLNVIWRAKAQNNQCNTEKNNKVGGLTLPNIKTSSKAQYQDSVGLTKTKT